MTTTIRGFSLAFLMLAAAVPVPAADAIIFSDDFESGLEGWELFRQGSAAIRTEPGGDNRVLELTPSGRFPPAGQSILSYALIAESTRFLNTRLEGRVLFPTDGDGYLGFIYNHRQIDGRRDFGCIYVKSNGSYIRVSPHYDGNPSWRLYEERKVILDGERRIKSNRWYKFRLDIRGRQAQLYFGDMTAALVTFDDFKYDSGSIGLEARPGRGDPVWVDDVRVTALPAVRPKERRAKQTSSLVRWQALLPASSGKVLKIDEPILPDGQWNDISPDARGALIVADLVQFDSGNANVVYLRARFVASDKQHSGWLAINTVNQLDIWLNGQYRGTVAPEQYLWSDYRSPSRYVAARLPISPKKGSNDLLVRVHGGRFAAGGFFASTEF